MSRETWRHPATHFERLKWEILCALASNLTPGEQNDTKTTEGVDEDGRRKLRIVHDIGFTSNREVAVVYGDRSPVSISGHLTRNEGPFLSRENLARSYELTGSGLYVQGSLGDLVIARTMISSLGDRPDLPEPVSPLHINDIPDSEVQIWHS